MMMNVFRQFFCWWPQSSDRLWASSSSSEDEFPIHGSLKRGTHTRKGKTLRESLMGRILWASREVFTTQIPRWNSVGTVRLCKPPSGWSRPCVRQIPAWHPLQKRTLVALMWPVQLLAPRGFSEMLSFDWLRLRLCLWIVRPQKAELIFKQWKLIQCCILYTGFLKGFCLKNKTKKIIKSKIGIWLKLLGS